MVNDILERQRLLSRVFESGDRPQRPLRNERRIGALWHVEDALLNLRGEMQKH